MPFGYPQANDAPTHMNLSYVLDLQPAGSFQYNGTTSTSDVGPATVVFAKSGLTEGLHTLNINVGPDSVFLLDYLVYTRNNNTAMGSEETSPGEALSGTEQVTGTGSLEPSARASRADLNRCV